MATAPAFISTGVISAVAISTANTNIDGTGTIDTLVLGSSTGTRILEINAQCSASSAAGLVNVFLSIDSGTTWRLFDQIAISAATVSTTVKGNRNVAAYPNLVLKDSTQRIGVTTTISQATNVFALGGAF